MVIKDGKTCLETSDIPPIKDSFARYYLTCWTEARKRVDISDTSFHEIKKTIISALVTDDRRDLVAANRIKRGPQSTEIIAELEAQGFIRSIPYGGNTFFYQLTHDRLVAPLIVDRNEFIAREDALALVAAYNKFLFEWQSRLSEEDYRNLRLFVETELLQNDKRVALSLAQVSLPKSDEVVQSLIRTGIVSLVPNSKDQYIELSSDFQIPPIKEARKFREAREEEEAQKKMHSEVIHKLSTEKILADANLEAANARAEAYRNRSKARWNFMLAIAVALLLILAIGYYRISANQSKVLLDQSKNDRDKLKSSNDSLQSTIALLKSTNHSLDSVVKTAQSLSINASTLPNLVDSTVKRFINNAKLTGAIPSNQAYRLLNQAKQLNKPDSIKQPVTSKQSEKLAFTATRTWGIGTDTVRDFENIRITLKDVSKTNEKITVLITDMLLKQQLYKIPLQVNRPFTFRYGLFEYSITCLAIATKSKEEVPEILFQKFIRN